MTQRLFYKGYTLIPFVDLNENEKCLILEWRNHKEINKFMQNQKKISLSEHLAYLTSLKKNKTKICFLVRDDDNYIGVIEFSDIKNTSCEISLNKNPNLEHIGKTLMDIIEYTASNILKIHTLKLSVLHTNNKAIHLYQQYNFTTTMQDKVLIYMEKNL